MAEAGNTRLIYAAIQSAKGTPAATPTHVFRVNGDAALNPDRVLIQLPETDGSAQRPDSNVVGADPKGGWSGWMRASEFAFLAHCVMGANANSGSTPNYTHTATPSKQLPYVTLWDVIPGRMCTRYVDGAISVLSASGEALQGIQYTVQAVALSAELGVTEPTVPSAPASDLKYTYPLVTVTVGGSAPGTHDAWSIEINRNVSLLRGDLGLAAFDRVTGRFDVSGTFRRIYESDADYRKVHGGSPSATTLTTAVFAETLNILIAENANRSVAFDSDGIEYTQITVPVNVDGAPILETLSFDTKRQPSWEDNLTIITKNGLPLSTSTPT